MAAKLIVLLFVLLEMLCLLPTTLVGWYVGMIQILNGRLNQCITRKLRCRWVTRKNK